MIGKAVKLAEGFLDTHSKKVVMNKGFLQDVAKEAKCEEATVDESIGLRWPVNYGSFLRKKIKIVSSHYFYKNVNRIALLSFPTAN